MNAINKSKLRNVLRWPAVLAATGYSKTQLEVKIRGGQFPRPFPLSDGGRAVGWWEDEIIAHQEQREAQRSEAAQERSQAAREQYQAIREAREARQRAGEAPPVTRRERRRRRAAERSEAIRERAQAK